MQEEDLVINGLYGVKKLHNFDDSVDREGREEWQQDLRIKGITVIPKHDDPIWRQYHYGDFKITSSNIGWQPNKIETKSINEKYYSRDKLILFETMGQVEFNNPGSAFSECRADIYAVAWWLDSRRKKLIDHIFLHVLKTQEWFKNNQHKYKEFKTQSTEGWTTLFKLVPLKDIPNEFSLDI